MSQLPKIEKLQDLTKIAKEKFGTDSWENQLRVLEELRAGIVEGEPDPYLFLAKNLEQLVEVKNLYSTIPDAKEIPICKGSWPIMYNYNWANGCNDYLRIRSYDLLVASGQYCVVKNPLVFGLSEYWLPWFYRAIVKGEVVSREEVGELNLSKLHKNKVNTVVSDIQDWFTNSVEELRDHQLVNGVRSSSYYKGYYFLVAWPDDEIFEIQETYKVPSFVLGYWRFVL